MEYPLRVAKENLQHKIEALKYGPVPKEPKKVPSGGYKLPRLTHMAEC